ncbi:dTDP-4-dehydrorhamnose 3,5-epimerase [Methylocystis sp. B8]|uniref:dTDP-4-dehydrorhamnose 3,5-epimerase n=1 Tax=Methylocystis sp. B8 TaxID=544938 RepID=UPI0010FE8775|nr:dTDP-4-dehydrorhamnose 3,5-epimerase [Methylocystis sp. B8]TLG77638.1 dTDP-4-dehydrorhamnose 3,5-epimerase [Methylocystis sp. B8]
MLKIEATDIPDVKIITPTKFGDQRGFFSEVYSRRSYVEAGVDLDFVQDNHALSAIVGTVRGLHFQSPPFAQHKLVRVARGRILDVAVDLRRSSPSFGMHVGTELSAENWRQLLVPIGFAHGYVVLEPDTEVLYKVTEYYAPRYEHGLAWDDPALCINWGIASNRAILSDKDRKHPCLADLPTIF